jgi:hypothetical protein
LGPIPQERAQTIRTESGVSHVPDRSARAWLKDALGIGDGSRVRDRRQMAIAMRSEGNSVRPRGRRQRGPLYAVVADGRVESTTAPKRSSPEAAERCAVGAGLDGADARRVMLEPSAKNLLGQVSRKRIVRASSSFRMRGRPKGFSAATCLVSGHVARWPPTGAEKHLNRA